jgi:hypothetical protein
VLNCCAALLFIPATSTLLRTVKFGGPGDAMSHAKSKRLCRSALRNQFIAVTFPGPSLTIAPRRPSLNLERRPRSPPTTVEQAPKQDPNSDDRNALMSHKESRSRPDPGSGPRVVRQVHELDQQVGPHVARGPTSVLIHR